VNQIIDISKREKVLVIVDEAVIGVTLLLLVDEE
jgi:hypothetical protein